MYAMRLIREAKILVVVIVFNLLLKQDNVYCHDKFKQQRLITTTKLIGLF